MGREDYISKRELLLFELKVEINGAVSHSMTASGIEYVINYGVSLPVLKRIASAYGPDHEFALGLLYEDIRELKLASFYIGDPSRPSPSELSEWLARVDNIELAECFATSFLSLSPHFIHMDRRRFIEYPVRYYSFIMAVARSTAVNHYPPAFLREIFTEALRIAEKADSNYLIRGTGILVEKIITGPAKENMREWIFSALEKGCSAAAGEIRSQIDWLGN